MKKPIYVDMDNTIFPLVELMTIRYNEKYGECVTFKDFKDYDIYKVIKKEHGNFFEQFATRELFMDSGSYPYMGAIEIISKLNEKYDVCFLTAGHPNTIEWRDRYLAKYFKFYSSGQLYVARDKSKVGNSGILIDDHLININTTNVDVPIVYSMPWNMGDITHLRTHRWDYILLGRIDAIMDTVVGATKA